MTRLLVIELNELNFDAVRHYIGQGQLPVFNRLIEKHGVWETTSEAEYDHLEPWIQWVSAHTGKTFGQHGIFRLGDIVNEDVDQIWEILEAKGLSVGAISPMNAKNRTSKAAFFVPDPWTPTPVTGGLLLKKLYQSVAQAVNDNAQSKITKESLGWLLAGAGRFARPVNYAAYMQLAMNARSRSWNKALFLDLLLADTFIAQVRTSKVDFATLFLNAAAHNQHHYMFSSGAYSGASKNPRWYVPEGADPVLDTYKLYDRILEQIQSNFKNARLMIATGLHQDPHHQTEYYWRLADHDAFLRKHSIPFISVEARMSRDFVVRCDGPEQTRQAARLLAQMQSEDGLPLFEVDCRDNDLFVMLIYPNDIGPDFTFTAGNRRHSGFRSDVAFVAIKNGKHNGIGYLIDTADEGGTARPRIALTELFPRMITAASGGTGLAAAE